MKNLYILILFILLNSKAGLSKQDILMNISSTIPVKLGDSVTITCKLSDLKSVNIPLMFKRKDVMISEDCKVFETDLYTMKCTENNNYQLNIKSMSWNEKGEWHCIYTSIQKTIELKIYVAPDVSMAFEVIPKQVSSNNLGPESFSLNRLNNPSIKGRGSKSNPYDLRNELSVKILCKSVCGYPTMDHTFIFRNSSNFSLQLSDKSFSHEKSECRDTERKSLFSSISNLELNCSSQKLYGLLNLTCSSIDVSHQVGGLPMVISQDSVFILCPTVPIEWWKMTLGEGISTGIGCFIGVILIMYSFLLVYRWKSNKYNDIEDQCQGDLMTKTNDSAYRGYRV